MSRRPDSLTLAAFLVAVFVLGNNFVAVRFSNAELEPFWGAASRFAVASLVLFAVVGARGIPLPRGRALVGAALFGVLGFYLSYALMYWGMQWVPAGVTSAIVATVPISTLFIAAAVGLERITAMRLLGGAIAAFGIAVLFSEQLTVDLPVFALLAVAVASVCISGSGVAVKFYPRSHPFATNAVATAIGAVLLAITSLAAGEAWVLPTREPTWIAWTWLVFSTVVGFVLTVWVLGRWTASAVGYSTVLMPIVAVTGGSILASEPITVALVAGAAIVIAGVYVGALRRAPAAPASAEPVPART